MHAYRRFVQQTMDAKNLRPADVERAGGPSAAVISKLLKDRRDNLVQRPDPDTVTAFARGLGVTEDAVLASVAEAMGLPLRPTVARLDQIPDDALLHELRRRLSKAGEHRVNTAPMNPQKHADPGTHGDRGDRTFDLSPTRARSETIENSVTTVTSPEGFGLAAHPDFELTRDRQDRQWADIGEESQDHGGHHSA